MILKILAIIALIGSGAWLYHSPDYEPAIACLTSLSACIATFIADARKKKSANQSQNVSGASIGIQAGRDAAARDIGSKR